MDIRVTISLVALNQREDLERLLPTLVPAAAESRAEVMLVENRSTDGARELVEREFPSVIVESNPRVAGYGENHNINLRKARGQYFVVMNSDMTVDRDTFTRLADYMDERPHVGMVAPKVLNADGTLQPLNKRTPTIVDLFVRRFVPRRFHKYFAARLARYEMLDVGYEHEYAVPNISGCFMFCRTDVLRSLGGFDERYFLYFEDFDLTRRMQRTHHTMYYPGVTVTHYWHRTAHKSWKYSYYFMRSALRYFNRWGYRVW
jgi:hypothetical protein